MGTSSIWHWVIVLGIFAGIGFITWRLGVAAREQQRPEGFRGWLLVLAIGQIVGLLRLLKMTGENYDQSKPVLDMPNGPLAVYGELALNTVFILFVGYVTYVMFSKSKRFPGLYTLQWIAGVALPIVDLLWVWAVLIRPDEAMAQEIVGAVIPTLVSGLWVLYVHKSVRVRNTFVR